MLDLRVSRVVLLVGAAVVVGVFAAEIWVTGSKGGFPLDDTFIHLRVAQNLIDGGGFGFNPGESLPATTSPLWVLLISFPGLLGANLMAVAKILSAISLIGAAYAAAKLAWRLSGQATVALAAGLGAVFVGRLLWAAASGMETLLFAAVTLAALERAAAREEEPDRRADISLGILLGAGALLRPEGMLLFVLWLVTATVQLSPRRLRMPPWWTVGIFAALVAPWVIFCLATTGHFFPSAVSAKLAFLQQEPPLQFLGRHLVEIFESNPVLAIAYPLGLVVALRRLRESSGHRLTLLWAVALPAAAAILLPVDHQHGRYLMPLLPVEMVLGAVGFGWLLKRLKMADAVRTPIVRMAFAVLIGLGIHGGYRYTLILGADVTGVNGLQVRMAAWARRSTPKKAVIAAAEIGALGYIGQRRIIDLAGIASPEVVPLIKGKRRGGEQDRALFAFLAKKRPDYLILYPDWYPHLTARPDLFEPMGLVRSETQTIAGGRLLVAYRAHWERYTPAPPIALAAGDRRLWAASAKRTERRLDDAWTELTELEARGPLDRGWRQQLYLVRARTALDRRDCPEARKALLHLDWLAPGESFRRRAGLERLASLAASCGRVRLPRRRAAPVLKAAPPGKAAPAGKMPPPGKAAPAAKMPPPGKRGPTPRK